MAQQNIPELFAYARNRTTCYGAVRNLIEFTEDIRFNACSEISFKVPQKIYNADTESWMDNPMYDILEEDVLIYVCDDHAYFKFPVRQPGDNTFYKRNLVTDPTKARGESTTRLNMNNYLSGFQVYPETELFDIGGDSGYVFHQFQKINGVSSTKSGELMDYTSYLNGYTTLVNAGNYDQYVACQEYIPIAATDVLVLDNWISNGRRVNPNDTSDTPYRGWGWHVECYTDADTATFVNEIVHTGDHIARIDVASILPDGGYIRLWYDCGSFPSSYFNLSGDSSSYSWSSNYIYPLHGFAKIYSGERYCSSIQLVTSTGWVYPKMHWFTITTTSEEDDGICRTKTVTAYSYEYTLKNKTITTTEDTLALYTPPAIYELINGLNTTGYGWLRDCYLGDNGTTIYGPGMAQHTPKGLLNYVLEENPGWSLGHISAKLMTTYRTIPAVDDTDIYSFLMDTVQQLYHCFFVFDNDNKTISAYTYNDMNISWSTDTSSGISLTWDNAIKSFQKENKATMSFTSLRIHTSDDQYGLGLVTPTGNNVIHNFNNILDELDFVPEGSPSGSRTLRTAVEAWQAAYSSALTSYRSTAKSFVSGNMRLVKAESAKEMALAEYRAVADKINTYLNDDYAGDSSLPTYLLGETPITYSQASNRDYKLCHTSALKAELKAAVRTYWDAYDELQEANTALYGTSGYYTQLTNATKPLTLDPLSTNNNAVLTTTERLALLEYIKEGSWTDSNATFSETYGVDDIYDTLTDVYNEALYDLQNRLNTIQYDFTVDVANIDAIPELKHYSDKLYLGRPFYLTVSDSEVILPIFLAKHINYKDDSDFSLSFTTDIRRSPLEFRYADLYGTITQTSVTDNTFTFDT